MTRDPILPRIDAPVGLVVDTFEEGGDTYALLEWPVGRASPDHLPVPSPRGVPAAAVRPSA